jgi:hypothetical protein
MPHVARLVPSRTPQTYSSDLVLLLSPSLARFSPGLRRVPELPRFVWNVTAPGTSLAVGPASAARVRLRQGGARLRQLAWTAGHGQYCPLHWPAAAAPHRTRPRRDDPPARMARSSCCAGRQPA